MLPEPAPDFSQPLELLHACHGRIEKQCATMLKLAEHVASHGCDQQAQQAAQGVLKYFSTAAVHHHEDEEHDLFPALQALAAGDDGRQTLVLVENLTAQHRDLEQAWNGVAPWLQGVARQESVACDPVALDRLVGLYRRHIELEETELLPYCRKVMDAAQLEKLGRSMAARRGVSWSAA
jgi:hemerythrin-like domain-containing protein